MVDLSAAWERGKRCDSCLYAPCVCVPTHRKAPPPEPQTLREAINQGLGGSAPQALDVETAVVKFLLEKFRSSGASGAERVRDMKTLGRILGLK